MQLLGRHLQARAGASSYAARVSRLTSILHTISLPFGNVEDVQGMCTACVHGCLRNSGLHACAHQHLHEAADIKQLMHVHVQNQRLFEELGGLSLVVSIIAQEDKSAEHPMRTICALQCLQCTCARNPAVAEQMRACGGVRYATHPLPA